MRLSILAPERIASVLHDLYSLRTAYIRAPGRSRSGAKFLGLLGGLAIAGAKHIDQPPAKWSASNLSLRLAVAPAPEVRRVAGCATSTGFAGHAGGLFRSEAYGLIVL